MTDTTLLRGFERHRLVASGITIQAYVAGAGLPLVLVHGLGGAATNYALLAPLLARRRRVILLDLPGHGRSGPLVGLPAQISSFATVVGDAVAGLGIDRAAYVGHSLGGAIALRLAVDRPAAVACLALVAGAGISSSTRRAKVGLGVARALRLGYLAGAQRERIVASRVLTRVAFSTLVGDPLALDQRAARGFLEGSARAGDRRTATIALFAEDARAELGRLTAPVLVLWGSRDRFLPLDDGFEWTRRLGARLRVVPGAGHLLVGEHPADCARYVEAFLDEHGS